MSESFQLGGDPAQIRVSARAWSAFSQGASSAASGIRSLDTSDFAGDEAETYKDRINSDLPKHLDTASTAWGVVATALQTYAGELERHQQAMSTLATRAGNQQTTVNSRQTALDSSRASDRSHTLSVLQTREALKPGEKMPADTYVSTTSGDQRSLSDAQSALQATFDAASKVRAENVESVRRCRAEIDRAKGMRFEKPPGFWGRLKNSVCDWIADHADVLLKISSVLKTISAVAGLLSMIPVLAPVMGPIALATGAAALVIDVGVKLATGKGSWLSIGIDAATMVLPGVGKVLGKGLKSAIGAERVAGGVAKARNAVSGSKAVAALRNSRVVTTVGAGLSRANAAVEKYALKVPGVRAANVRAGRLPATAQFKNVDDAMTYARPRLQYHADRAWKSATAKSDPAYRATPGAQGPPTRWDAFKDRYGRNPSSAVQGTWAHSDLERALADGGGVVPPGSGFKVRTEVSYGPGGEVSKGTSDSVRPDVVITRDNGAGTFEPAAVVDLKTGQAGIKDSWAAKVSDRTGIDTDHIEELRPGGGLSIAPSSGGGSASGGFSYGTAVWSTPVAPMPSLFTGGTSSP